MKIYFYEKIFFLILLFLLLFSSFNLFKHISFIFFQNTFIEGLDDENDENNENDENDDDEDPSKTDYTKLIKSVHSMGFSDKGSWNSLTNNVKAMKNIVQGISTNQTKLVKGGNAIGIKLVSDTGFTCNDPNGDKQELYTYLDNSGDPSLGLAGEVGNAVVKYTDSMRDISNALSGSTDSTCEEVELDIITNSGKKKTETVHLQKSEIDYIDPKNIISKKSYGDDDDDDEGFKNINNLLINDKLFYKDNGVFLYFILLNSLFMYYILILSINSS